MKERETIFNPAENISSLHDKNNEYLRGYREGQGAAARELAGLFDEIMGRYNHLGDYLAWQDNHQTKQDMA